MVSGLQLAIPVCIMTSIALWTSSDGVFIPNLSETCYRCLCHVSTKCDQSHECTAALLSNLVLDSPYDVLHRQIILLGYCGPFNISRVYWVDAGRVTLPDDDPDRNHAWEDCARSYHCSKRIIEGYLQRFGKDCNSDGVTDCFDYMMVNGNGGYGCSAPLNRSANGRRWLQRFQECRHSL